MSSAVLPFGVPSWEKLQAVMPRACALAGQSLSEFAQEPVIVHGAHIDRVPWAKLPFSLASTPESPIVGAVLGVQGDASGSVALLFSPDAAANLAALMLGEEQVCPLDEMGVSALGEVANITGTTLLNALAEAFGPRLTPTVPYVVEDQIGAVLESLVPESARGAPTVLVISTVFQIKSREIAGFLLMFPDVPFTT
jgi:chemotaxis protein CheY-P-specific phosphatase CheC